MTINDTIAAIATPLAKGGVAIVRISGIRAFGIIDKIFNYKNELQHSQAKYGHIVEGDKIIDEVLVLPFKSPKSFTGENVIEIHCHGGIYLVKQILDLCLKNGARLAERGEFSKRAFLNGKKDLTRVEAILEVINSKTSKALEASSKSLTGSFAEFVKKSRKNLIEILSMVTASIDFPEEVPEPDYNELLDEISSIIQTINDALKNAEKGAILRDGIKVAVVGEPNVGKSSLFNALLNANRAIVTEIEGTTRDALQETIEIEGIPVTFIDTAGIRETQNKVEKIGVDIAKSHVETANTVLFLEDITKENKGNKLEKYLDRENVIRVRTKADLMPNDNINGLKISSLTGEGIEELKKEILAKASAEDIENTEFMVNARQKDCLHKAKQSLEYSIRALENNIELDLISIDLKSAVMSLGEISGEEITDELLDNIFSNFCIGK